MSIRHAGRLLLVSAWGLASPAQAHLVQTGFGDFYDGIAHVALTPADLLLVITVALLAGQRGTLAVLHADGPIAAVRHYFADRPLAAVPAAVLAAIFAAKMFGVVVCAAFRARLRMSAAAWLVLLIVATASLAGGPASTPRFRVPVAPLLSVAAAVGWMRLVGGRRRAAHASSLPAGAGGEAD